MKIRVIGGGLAGPEAALTAARLGCEVELYEMRTMVDGQPRLTPAHQTVEFGELVCSNSLKSESENTAPWLLKQEMRRAGSALMRCADETAVPAGHALAVDRVEFSRRIGAAIEAELARNELVVAHPTPLSSQRHYFLLYPDRVEVPAAVLQFSQWLQQLSPMPAPAPLPP